MKKKKTKRGFSYFEFKDSNNVKCSIQKSSSVEEKIWLGADSIGLKKMVGLGPFKDVNTSSVPNQTFVANNRMHLNKKQVLKLIEVLNEFVKTGDL